MDNQTEDSSGKYNFIIAILLIGSIVVIVGIALVVSNFNNITGWFGKRALTGAQKIGQTIEDPDKDRDGLEDKIIEPQVYKTNPEKADTDGNGISDGQDVYDIYKNAFATNNETAVVEYENNFNLAKQKTNGTLKVGSLEEMFNQRVTQEDLTKYLRLAGDYKEKNQLDKAEEAYNQGLKIEPRYAAFYNGLAIIATSKGDVSRELELYKKAVSYDFRNASVHFNLSILFDEYNHDLNSALVEARIAMSLDQNNPKYMSRASVIYAALGKKDKANELENQVLKMGGASADVFNELGLKYDSQGDKIQAENYYRKAIQADPKFANAYNNLGTVLSVTKRESEAIVNYKKAIELDPNYANAYGNLGWQYSNIPGRILESIPLLEKSISLNPNLHRPYGNLGNVYWVLNDKMKAKFYYTKAVELGSTDEGLIQRLKTLQ